MEQNLDALVHSYDSSSQSYDEQTSTFHHTLQEYVTVQNLLHELEGRRSLKILDSGGGTGKYAIQLAKSGFDITLSDVSPASIEIARLKIQREGLQIDTFVCNSEATKFQNQQFDVVLMNGAVISYSPDPDKLLHEAKRILKPGGLLWFDFFNSLGWAIECPDIRYKPEIAAADNKLIQMPDWDYPARIFSQNEIQRLLDKSGFAVKSKYGLIILSNSLSLDMRYSEITDKQLLSDYCQMELQLSRDQSCLGTAWSISVSAMKST